MYEEMKVSVLTPNYNSEKYVADTIRSLQAQTHTNWEMIVVDDCSKDGSFAIVEEFARQDPRIIPVRQEVNGGAAAARNRALQEVTGRFVAYLDADDIWLPQKLEKQIAFMREKDCGFPCASYEVINDAGQRLNKNVFMLPKVDYTGYLTNNLLQTVGIMVDTDIVDKSLLVMPRLHISEDAATWLQILKAGHPCYGTEEILAQYRRAEKSLSSNKFKAVRAIWTLYRKVEKLPLPFSCYCFVRYAFLAVWKRLYPGKNK